ncbi:DUF3265 domain-containing protein [Vibrio vulnificus]|nr:DUF3265 domain-containing protein [Vibrio vulnificus]MBN8152227.1 DUF3265 domain-containing protein [Vibrio vulnificus]NIG90115.1 DUF3265 domain-containing protein [Vibrio vulnificus]PUZ79032.1 hypothetical protein DC357_21380 [Vibrio vulnificus]
MILVALTSYITRRLRGIHAAWHFWHAVSFGGESGLRKAGLGGIPPLTQRYTAINHLTFSWLYGKHRYVRVFRLLRRLQ